MGKACRIIKAIEYFIKINKKNEHIFQLKVFVIAFLTLLIANYYLLIHISAKVQTSAKDVYTYSAIKRGYFKFELQSLYTIDL